MCQTRAGESGSWFGIAPNEAKALATALAIRPPIGMIAPSPAPLTPSGLLGDRWFSSASARILGKSVAVGIRYGFGQAIHREFGMTVEALAGRLLRTPQVCPAALPASSATQTHHFPYLQAK